MGCASGDQAAKTGGEDAGLRKARRILVATATLLVSGAAPALVTYDTASGPPSAA